MKITFTPEQWEAFDTELLDVEITYIDDDDNEQTSNLKDEDDLRRNVTTAFINIPGVEYASYDDDGNPVGDPVAYVVAHPSFNWESEILLKHGLDQRVTLIEDIKSRPPGQRAARIRAIRRNLKALAESDNPRRALRRNLPPGSERRAKFIEWMKENPALRAKIKAKLDELEAEREGVIE